MAGLVSELAWEHGGADYGGGADYELRSRDAFCNCGACGQHEFRGGDGLTGPQALIRSMEFAVCFPDWEDE